MRAHLVQETNGVILGHEIRLRDGVGLRTAKTKKTGRMLPGRGSLLGLTLPSPHDITGNREKVVGGDQSSGGNGGGLVDNGGFDETLDTLNCSSLDLVSTQP